MTEETENAERAGWMPRFTIRTLMVICTVCAVASVIIGTAFRGQYWAWGVTIGLFSLVVTALVHAAWFGFLWIFARVPERRLAHFPPLARAQVAGATTAADDNSELHAKGSTNS